MFAGVYAGTVLHVGVDILTHTSMPYLWTFAGPVNTLSFTRDFWWLILVNMIQLAVLLALLRIHLGRMEDTAPGK